MRPKPEGLDPHALRAALRDIGLALNACHNTVATDRPGAEPDDASWRIDHTKEVALVHALERTLLATTNPP